MAVQNLIRASLHWSGHGEEGTVTAHFAGGGLTTEQGLHDIAAAADDHLTNDETPSGWTVLQRLLDTGQSYDDLALYQYASAPGPATVLTHYAPAGGRPGTLAPSHPLQVACVVSIGTGSASRRKRGRAYMPGHCLQIDTDTQFTSAGIEDACDGYTAFAGAVLEALRALLPSGDATRHGVYSPTGGIFTPSTTLEADSRPDVQRRRAASQQPVRTSTVNHVNPTS